MIDADFVGARVLRPDGWSEAPLAISDGRISDTRGGTRQIDLRGYRIVPGIIDLHGDGFERHMAPRRGALREREAGIRATAAELAANGITTGFIAQFWSWEGGLRGPDFAETVFQSVTGAAGSVPIDLRLQLRLETHLIDDFARAEAAIDRYDIRYVVFNDHLPHDRLAEGRRPPRLTGQALKAGRNPDAHFAFLMDLHARGPEVPEAVSGLAARLGARGVVLGSHDDHTAEARATWRARGASVAEFPETQAAAQAAKDAGEGVILGAPNLVRGASHKGNASAAWALVSSGPARVLGLTDRGSLEDGKRADLVILDEAGQIAATLAGGQVAFMSGPIATRFFA